MPGRGVDEAGRHVICEEPPPILVSVGVAISLDQRPVEAHPQERTSVWRSVSRVSALPSAALN